MTHLAYRFEPRVITPVLSATLTLRIMEGLPVIQSLAAVEPEIEQSANQKCPPDPFDCGLRIAQLQCGLNYHRRFQQIHHPRPETPEAG